MYVHYIQNIKIKYTYNNVTYHSCCHDSKASPKQVKLDLIR